MFGPPLHLNDPPTELKEEDEIKEDRRSAVARQMSHSPFPSAAIQSPPRHLSELSDLSHLSDLSALSDFSNFEYLLAPQLAHPQSFTDCFAPAGAEVPLDCFGPAPPAVSIAASAGLPRSIADLPSVLPSGLPSDLPSALPPPSHIPNQHRLHHHSHHAGIPDPVYGVLPGSCAEMDPSSIKGQSETPADEHSLAAQEAAARDYQPDYQDPLVGEKVSSHAIVEMYAKADPIYIEKTASLSQTYSHFRPIRGDGNCGWRAVGFSYFEFLINRGDYYQIGGEVARVTSLNQGIIRICGFPEYLFEDMAAETISLLKELATLAGDVAASMELLTTRFNDAEKSNAIIYHLRLLVSSHLKAFRETYDEFISESYGGVDGYCASVVEVVNREIDHTGISALIDKLLKPVGCVLEICYLDLTPGSISTTYRFPEDKSDEEPGACLLFRPEHYDILYRAPPPPPLPQPASIGVHQVSEYRPVTFSQNTTSFGSFPNVADYSFLFDALPGYERYTDDTGVPSLMSPLLRTNTHAPQFAPQPQPVLPPALQTDNQPGSSDWMNAGFGGPLSLLTPSPVQMPMPPPVGPPPSGTAPDATVSPSSQQDPFRFGKAMWDLQAAPPPEPELQTNTFKQSHHNKAHFSNPEFHPDIWKPPYKKSEDHP